MPLFDRSTHSEPTHVLRGVPAHAGQSLDLLGALPPTIGRRSTALRALYELDASPDNPVDATALSLETGRSPEIESKILVRLRRDGLVLLSARGAALTPRGRRLVRASCDAVPSIF